MIPSYVNSDTFINNGNFQNFLATKFEAWKLRDMERTTLVLHKRKVIQEKYNKTCVSAYSNA